MHRSVVLALIAVLAGCSDDQATSSTPRGSSSSGATSSSGGTSSSGDIGDPGADGGSSTSSSGSSTSSSGSPASGANGTCKIQGQAHKTGLTSLTHSNGLKYSVYAPANYDKNVGHTVVVLMHGQDSDGTAELNTLWKPIADSDQLVLIAPRGSRPPTTGTTGGNWATADLDLVLEIMADVDTCYDVFTKKHILWGFSEGAFYGYLLGIGAAEEFSGLAMGGANTSFARQNGYPPSAAKWKIPVSHVHGKMDFNQISLTYQDRDDFIAAGHVFTLHEHDGGHSITPAQVKMQWDDLKASSSP